MVGVDLFCKQDDYGVHGWWDLMGWSSKFVYICDALVTQTSMAFLNRLFISRSRLLALSPGIAVRRLTVQRKIGRRSPYLRGLSEY